jgi:hypothetical protein
VNLGITTINIISDGTYLMDGGCVFGQVPKAQWELQVKPDWRNLVQKQQPRQTWLCERPKNEVEE